MVVWWGPGHIARVHGIINVLSEKGGLATAEPHKNSVTFMAGIQLKHKNRA